MSGSRAQRGSRDSGDVTTRFPRATSADARSSDAQHAPRSAETDSNWCSQEESAASSVFEQLDLRRRPETDPETDTEDSSSEAWEWGNGIDEGDEFTISMMAGGADPDEGSDDEKKNKPIGKPPLFSGAEKDWSDYSWRMLSWCCLIKLDCYMEEAATRPIPVNIAGEPAKTQKKAALLYHYLIISLQGKALGMLRSVDRSNGLEAWRKLCLQIGRAHV